MTCSKCRSPVIDPYEHCPACGGWAGGWADSAWLFATYLVPALWFVGYIAVLGMSW
jgi:hypothetical protein